MAEHTVFSDYEVRNLGFKIGANETIMVPCVGSFEEELEVLVISKKCRGVEKKTRARGKGTGTVKISAHVPSDLLTALYGMGLDDLKEGVTAYGQKSLHPEFALTADVFDEDDNEKLKAYPRCLIKSNLSRKTENGAEEVAELELEISIMPDDDGNGVYEYIVGSDAAGLKTAWMANFDVKNVKEANA